MRRNFTTIFALMVAVTTGCVSDEVQRAKISLSFGTSLGYSGENQTDSQKISWTVSIANTGAKTAKNVTFVILQNRKWVYYTLALTLFVGLYLVFSCFYCIG